MKSPAVPDIDAYIQQFDSLQQKMLTSLRNLVKEVIPEATEIISYQMPAFRFHGMLLYMAAYKQHIGFYPGSKTSIQYFADELKSYKTSAGTIQLPLTGQIPVELIRKIIQFRKEENLKREQIKQANKGKSNSEK